MYGQNFPASIDLELVVQLQDNWDITFELTNTTTAQAYSSQSECEYSNEPNYTSYVEVEGPYFGLYHGFKISSYGYYPDEQMKHSLNLLRFKWNGEYIGYYDPEDILTFYYDTRDCNYYSSCEYWYTQDATIRLVIDGNYTRVWFFPGHETSTATPSPANGWVEVSQGSKNVWDVKGYTYCDMDWASSAPTIPQNFYVSGSIGQHPVLHWQQNREPDLEGYKVYRSIDGSAYQLLATIDNPTTTSYTDDDFYITSKVGSSTYCYKVSAYDDTYESDKTGSNCVYGPEYQQKRSAAEEISEVISEYKLCQAYPNPFNPLTTIVYQISEKGFVSIKVYDLLGKAVATLVEEIKDTGVYDTKFDASNLSSGTYIYTISVNDYYDVKKVMVIK